MSIVIYNIGDKKYSFSTDLQIANLLAVETILIEDIKNHMHATGIKGSIHDITIKDENGLIAHANDFKSNNLNLEIKNIKQ